MPTIEPGRQPAEICSGHSAFKRFRLCFQINSGLDGSIAGSVVGKVPLRSSCTLPLRWPLQRETQPTLLRAGQTWQTPDLCTPTQSFAATLKGCQLSRGLLPKMLETTPHRHRTIEKGKRATIEHTERGSPFWNADWGGLGATAKAPNPPAWPDVC